MLSDNIFEDGMQILQSVNRVARKCLNSNAQTYLLDSKQILSMSLQIFTSKLIYENYFGKQSQTVNSLPTN